MAITISAETHEQLIRLARALVNDADPTSVDARALPTDLTEQVTAFHAKFGYLDRQNEGPVLDFNEMRHPAEELRNRATLIAGEFVELMGAFGIPLVHWALIIMAAIKNCDFQDANLAKIAHELADLDYVNEGTRLTLGIPRRPVAAEVHRANMEKVEGVSDGDGSPHKPPGWKPPQIVDILIREQEARTDEGTSA